MEKLIAGLDANYRDIREKSFKNLDVKIRHIEEFKQGRLPGTDTVTS